MKLITTIFLAILATNVTAASFVSDGSLSSVQALVNSASAATYTAAGTAQASRIAIGDPGSNTADLVFDKIRANPSIGSNPT